MHPFTMLTFFVLLAYLDIGLADSASPIPANPVVASVETLGPQHDPNFPKLTRDGGGGATVNGYHLMVYADTTNAGNFCSNSVAYAGYRDHNDSALLFDFGKNKNDFLAFPPLANERGPRPGGGYFAIWPNSALADTGSGKAVGIFDCVRRGFQNHKPFWIFLYSTMATVEVGKPVQTINPVTERVIPELFGPSETHYGSFGVYHDHNGFLYMFAGTPYGLKVARVTMTHMTSRSKFEYWNGKVWLSAPPPRDELESNLFNYRNYESGPSSGRVFYDYYHRKYLCVFMDGIGSRFMMTSAPSVVGPWTKATVLWNIPSGHFGHAYPGFDSSGRTLMLSYWQQVGQQHLARVHWI